MPLFNGGREENLIKFKNCFWKVSNRKIKNNHWWDYILKHKNSFFFMDIESPPKKIFQNLINQDLLSFEYFIDGIKIITNCGFGNLISKKRKT